MKTWISDEDLGEIEIDTTLSTLEKINFLLVNHFSLEKIKLIPKKN